MIAAHDIRSLWVGHWPKPASGAGLPVLGQLREHALVLDTCLRQVVLTASPDVARIAGRLAPPETHTGAGAYRLLLEIATGLRSAVPGETNVFGQLKRAWEAFRRAGHDPAVMMLAPAVAQLMRDTREIRRDHLQHIGGGSYGTLVRRLIRPEASDRILIVGAGELARAMLPLFRGDALGVWSRRPPGALFNAAARVFAPEQGAVAAAWADHVVMTTPPDERNDALWRGWLGASGVRTVVHLGRRRGAPCEWPARTRTFDLDDVFDLQRTQANIRSLQIERARLACHERARRLGADAGGHRDHRATG
jgi:hypothetical protein